MRNMKTGKKVMAGTLAAIMVSSAAMTAYAATEHWNDGSQGATTEWTQWKTDCCLLYTSPSPRDRTRSRMPSSA